MSDPRPDVAEVFRTYGAAYRQRFGHTLSADQKRLLTDISQCRISLERLKRVIH